jgi:hypothetical protein
MYTLRDVNKLRATRGWPRLMALEYYVNLGKKLNEPVAANVLKGYAEEMNRLGKRGY